MLSKYVTHQGIARNVALVRLASRTSSSAVWSADDAQVQQALVQEVSSTQMESAKAIVPWYLKNMPLSYFQQVNEDIRKQHLKAVAAFSNLSKSDLSLKIETKGTDGFITVTHFDNAEGDGKNNALLQENLKRLTPPPNTTLAGVKLFQSCKYLAAYGMYLFSFLDCEVVDSSLSMQMFSFESTKQERKVASRKDADAIYNLAAEIRSGEMVGKAHYPKNSPLCTEEALTEYLSRCTPQYASIPARRFLIQRNMYEKVRNTDKTWVHVEAEEGGLPQTWITIASANTLPDSLFRSSAALLHAFKCTIQRAHMDTIQDPENSTPELPGYVTMLRVLVDKDLTRSVQPEELQNYITALKRAKWYDNETVDLGLRRRPELGLDRAEVITAVCSMLHGPLSKANTHAFSSIKSIVNTIDADKNFIGLAAQIADLFLDKFRPESHTSTSEYARRERELRNKFEHAHAENIKVDLNRVTDAKVVLNKMMDAVNATLRTNFYNIDRYALCLRVNPSIMATDGMGLKADRPLPYGVYFAHGRHFNAFHCRFRDIARGGLRVVTPKSPDEYVSESSKHFDEVYNLSYAQQLKNKDIPEGGAKAVIIVNAPNISKDSRFYAIRKAIRAFTDSCFDLMVKDSVNGLVDHLKKDELLYFGPDEQVIPSDVDWITQRAAQRGYPIPAAFMSSKPGPGFNHKVYGVTSEGVAVYLEVALKKKLGIDPRTAPFTVKITGGPDGDVAGNLMKILIREYGANARIVGVADGFGVAEDPNGLNHEELTRLIRAELPISHFSKAKLSKDGSFFDASTDEGAHRRNTMVFRVKADAFVPCGGRPNTINKENWMQFIDANGVPTSKLIVEGANLYNTKEAREQMFTKGIAIVKDSTANKCGVQTSSYEVQASMLLSKEEFMANKEALVRDVLVKLKEAAKYEAELLFREYNNYPGSLPVFGERISNCINYVTDAIMTHLESIPPTDPFFKQLFPLVIENLPAKLAELAGDRVAAKFPLQYQRCAIASTLASRLVYQEGVHFIEAQPVEKVAQRAYSYYLEDRRMKQLVKELDKKDLGVSAEQKKEILHLISKGGARTSLDIF